VVGVAACASCVVTTAKIANESSRNRIRNSWKFHARQPVNF